MLGGGLFGADEHDFVGAHHPHCKQVPPRAFISPQSARPGAGARNEGEVAGVAGAAGERQDVGVVPITVLPSACPDETVVDGLSSGS